MDHQTIGFHAAADDRIDHSKKHEHPAGERHQEPGSLARFLE